MGAVPPPPPAGVAPPASCPSCGAPFPAGTRFCGQCGAAITAAGGSSASSPAAPLAPLAPTRPVDLREKIEADRGGLKRLQLLVPGFRGYRIGEDLRDADSILRREVADKVLACLGDLTAARQALVQANEYGSLNDLALAVSDLTVLEGQIRHGAQGYTGISAAIRVQPKDLERLYEYDYGFVLASEQLRAAIGPLTAATAANDAGRIRTEVARVRALLGELEQAFRARLSSIEGVQV
ncbi:MAG: zinc ribbon domain-containing protein [Thermoplasmata archaeon]